MFTLSHLNTPPPESMKSQVLQMVVDYLGDISPVSLMPSNPLYQLYQYVVGFEVHRYLDSMDGAQAGKPELIMALDADDPAELLGFALYLPYVDDPEACSLLYLAVQESHRRQGIGRAMVEGMMARYSHAEVACVASKVSYFELLGFLPLVAPRPASRDEHTQPGVRRYLSGAGSGANLPVGRGPADPCLSGQAARCRSHEPRRGFA